ncbi:epidermal differentiation-specific protein-like [Scyliorhinus torazame]|uniref:epidermal differentiation-specific protein-like n=1 Tax=Scyliorhinus torazame TaxID=75743 RepID=UPI003B5BC1BA
MNKVVLYDGANLNGNWKEFTDNVPDLGAQFFANNARSLKVIGKHLVAYKGTRFTGDFVVYGPGEHPVLGPMDKQIQSLRLVKEELGNPHIVLYEAVHFDKQSRDIEEDINDLVKGGFPDLVSSHKVKQGVWILYEGLNYSGKRLITFQGDEWADYRQLGWKGKMSSLKPLKSSDEIV